MAKAKDYLYRITNASPVELVIISYDIMLDDLNEAMNHGTESEEFIAAVSSVRDVLAELVLALDQNYPITGDIFPIYEYVNTLLLSALIYEKKDKLEEAAEILGILREGWIKAKDSEPAAPSLFANAPKVYTGLTYGRKGLSDYVDENPNRGIKV